MAKFEMYQQFENRKSGRIAHVARIDETCKTIILMYDEAREGDKENGVTLSYPSVSKNWKRLDTYAHPDLSSSEVKKADKTTEDKKTEDKASDGTSYSEVMQEIVEDEKKAVKQVKSDKKKSKKHDEPKQPVKKEAKAGKSFIWSREYTEEVFSDLVTQFNEEYIAFSIKLYEKIKNFILVRYDDKSVVEIKVSRSGITVNCKEDLVPSYIKDYKVQKNYYMPATFKFVDNWKDELAKFLKTIDKKED